MPRIVESLNVKRFRFDNRFCQLFFHFCLCLAEDTLGDSFAGFLVIPGSIPTLPASILALADVAFTVCPFLCHVCASCSVVAQTTTTEPAQSLLIFSEDRNIFHAVPRASEISILCLLRRSFYTISDIEMQFLRKFRTVKTVLFLAAKKACKHVRRSFHSESPIPCMRRPRHFF